MSAPAPPAGAAPESRDAPRRPSGLAQLRTLSLAMWRGFVRDRTALFFTFLFPLMFLVVFGLVFDSGDAEPTEIGVVGGGQIVESLPDELFDVARVDTVDEAVEQVRAGDLPAVLYQEGDRAELRYAASDRVTAGLVRGLVTSVVNQANLAATGQPARFTLEAQQVEDTSLETIQYFTPGILSWGVATSAAFGAALTLVAWRRKQILRRVRLAPAPVWAVATSRIGVSVLVAVIQAALFIGIALSPPFGLVLTGQWWLAVPLLICGTLSFLAVGMFIGALAKTEEAASALANFVVLPMAFLSGTFFSISAAPDWMVAISRALPLRYMSEGMTDVLVRGQGASALAVPCAVLLAFGVVVALIATRLFRWDEA